MRCRSCKLACVCPGRSAVLLCSGPAPSCPCCCQVLGSIAATTLFFAFALTTFVVWIRCPPCVAARVSALLRRCHYCVAATDCACAAPLLGHSRRVCSSYIVPYGTYMRADCLVLNSTQTMLAGLPLSRPNARLST